MQLRHPVAASVVIVVPLVAVVILVLNARGMALEAVAQYQALLHYLAATVLEIRQKLPPELAAKLPDGMLPAQQWLVEYLQSQARALTGFGTAGLRGSLLVYVGLVVGALIAGGDMRPTEAPLRRAMRARGAHFIASFRQSVVAQFWIAAFNAGCTAVFLFVALPLAGVTMPVRRCPGGAHIFCRPDSHCGQLAVQRGDDAGGALHFGQPWESFVCCF